MRIEITNPQGINADLPAYELGNETWSSGNNVHFRSLGTSKADGYGQVFGTLSGSPYFHMPWTDFNNLFWFYADNTNIYRTDGTSHVSVGSGYNAAFEGGWTGSSFNGVAIFNNGVDAPQWYDPSTGLAGDLTAWPASTSASVVRPYKNYLIAMDITKAAGAYPVMVKWSDSSDAGGVPQSWDEADPATQAGENILPDSLGRIVDGLALNDTFFIYKQDSIWAMAFIGGNSIFSFRKVFNDTGVLGRDCVVEFEGRHFVIGRGDIYVHDGNTKQSVASRVVKNEIFSNTNQDFTSRIKCVTDSSTKEIWVYYPSKDSLDGTADKAWVWNWESNTWSPRQISNIAHITTGPLDPNTDEDWNSDNNGWNSDSSKWGERDFITTESKVVLLNMTGKKMYQANFTNNIDGVPYTSFVERVGLDFGDDQRFKFVSEIVPHLSGEGVVRVYVGSETHQGSGVRWNAGMDFTIGTDYRSTCRVNGRYIAVRFESIGESSWELSGYSLEYQNKGRQ